MVLRRGFSPTAHAFHSCVYSVTARLAATARACFEVLAVCFRLVLRGRAQPMLQVSFVQAGCCAVGVVADPNEAAVALRNDRRGMGVQPLDAQPCVPPPPPGARGPLLSPPAPRVSVGYTLTRHRSRSQIASE